MELPFQENSHVKKFAIKHRFTESKEDVKTVLSSLEKEDLLTVFLIPIAFNDDMDREIHLNSMFVDTKDSTGNQKHCTHAMQQNSKDWISFSQNIQCCL